MSVARLRRVALQAFRVCLVVGCALPTGCSWTGTTHDSNPQVYGLNDRVPEGGGRFKVGDPYRVGGELFVPRDDPTYDKTGIASWYGDYFHGRKTANGEWYDMNRLSAAHPTLPLPVYARVTNTQNGRSVVVRINDRGPFAHGRIIDLSKGAARELGMVQAGTAPVRVTYIGRAPLEGDIPDMQYADRRGLGSVWPFNTAALGASGETSGQGAPAATGSLGRPERTASASLAPGAGEAAFGDAAPGVYVQVASFTDAARAQSLAAELQHLGVFQVLPASVAGSTYYRVRSAPVADRQSAQALVSSLATAGMAGSQVMAH